MEVLRTFYCSLLFIFLGIVINYIIDHITFNLRDNYYKVESIQKNFTINEQLFTIDELKQFKGLNKSNNNLIYISILGKVYNVTSGAKYYGPGSTYHVFAGRDVSRAFVTGEFEEDKLTDTVLDLPLTDLKALKDWKDFYDKQYEFKGKLIGRFFDENGEPTYYRLELEKRFEELEQIDVNKLKLQRMYPPCNVEWDSKLGTRVWCTKKSGGIDRDWIGYPRKLYAPGEKTHRCACVQPNLQTQGNVEEYENCPTDATSCYINTEKTTSNV